MNKENVLGVITRQLPGHETVVSKVIIIPKECDDSYYKSSENKLVCWSNDYVNSFIQKFQEFKAAKWVLTRSKPAITEADLYEYPEIITTYVFGNGVFLEIPGEE